MTKLQNGVWSEFGIGNGEKKRLIDDPTNDKHDEIVVARLW